MSSFGRQYSTSSPVMTMSPQPSHHSPYSGAGFAHQQIQSQAQAPLRNISMSAMATTNRPAISGRKRSRDEAAVNLDPPAKPQVKEEKWVYGPGMVLIKADAGYVADASSQSGTWLEEKHAADERRLQDEAEQREPRSHKVQRVVVADNAAAAPESSLAPAALTAQDNKDPVIDDFTLHLGIGWRKISDDEHIQAAARGWARYIENHYPVSNAHIRLESKGLQSYLVEASEGFFLFAENLRQGQFVSATVQGALKNLSTSPPTFEGATLLVATESPALSPSAPADDADMNLD